MAFPKNETDDDFSFDSVLKTLPPEKKGFPTLSDIMSVNLVVNDRSEILLLHDKQFPFLLNWAEFDADLSKLSLIGFNGASIELGMDIPKKLHKSFFRNTHIKTTLLQNKELVDFYVIPLISRHISRK